MSEKIKAHVAEFKVTKQSVVVEIPVHIARKMLDGRAAINSHTLELANAIELALVEFEENERKNEDDIPF